MKKYFYSFLLLSLSFSLNAQIQHVEPLNWWVGMKNPIVQLLVNGKDVGETTPFIKYPGVSIVKATKGDSKNYLFIDLKIANTTIPGTFTIEFKKGGKTIYAHPYSIMGRQNNGSTLKGFDASDAVYLITPDRFANGDPQNDVVSGLKERKADRGSAIMRHGGDLRGIIDHLDYIKNLGFTAIWPTPMLENDMPEYSYHGYAITNYYKVDPRFGTMEEYIELAQKAKKTGIKIIFDAVLNHSGLEYWWKDDLPFKDWLNHPDSMVMTTHQRTVNQDPYASQRDKDLMHKGWFSYAMPDMNGANSFVANYLIQNSIWWIETLQLGGIRQDTYGYSEKALLEKWSCTIMKEYPNFSLVGEEWSYNPLITSYWQKGKKRSDGYNSCLNTIMDFPLQGALVEGLQEDDNPNYAKGLNKMYTALANDFVYAKPDQMLVMGDNHDMDRLFTQLHEDVNLMQMALTYLLTIRGIPQIYYGTEVLMQNTAHSKVDGMIRSDFPGGFGGEVDAFTRKGLSDDQLNIQTYFSKLLNWRKDNPVIHSGKTLHFAPEKNMYVFFRHNKEKTVMVVLNKNPDELTVQTSKYQEILNGKKTATNVITGEKHDLANPLMVAGRSGQVFEIN
ncbi:MAG: glycoside hydrolase family 13 protein [Saprospiraceae bacterium]